MLSGTVRSFTRITLVGLIGLGFSLVVPAPEARATTPATCSNVLLVLDESGSVDPHETTVRNGVHSFLDPLAGSGVASAIVEFGSSATTVFGYTSITATNLTSIFDPYIDATSATDVYDPPSQLGPYTNWDDALDEVSIMNAAGPVAPIVLFITDGDPTAYNLDQSGEPGGVFVNGVTTEALTRAEQEADQVRGQGSHLIAVGVGSALSNSASIARLQQLAGPDVYNGSGTFNLAATDVVLVPDFADLPAAMSLIAQAMCADPAISVEKTVSQQAVVPGTTVTYEVTVTNTGNVDLHDVVVDDPLVPGCSQVVGTLTVGQSVTVTCSSIVWAPLTNVVTATGTDPFGTPVTDDGSAQVVLLATGTGTPGFWKNHPDVWPIAGGELLIGDWNHNWSCDAGETCLLLTEEEAMAALSTPPKGDMSWNMARALVAAWLNVSAGNDSSCIAETIELATAWLLANPLGSDVSGGDLAWRDGSEWARILDDYNNGLLCAEHRDANDDLDSEEATLVDETVEEPSAAATPVSSPTEEKIPPPQAPAVGRRTGDEPPSGQGQPKRP